MPSAPPPPRPPAQTNDDLRALILRFFSDYCSEEEAVSSELVGGADPPGLAWQVAPYASLAGHTQGVTGAAA